MNPVRRALLAALAAAAGIRAPLASSRALLRVVVPQANSGAVDLVSRRIGDALDPALDEAVFIDNRPGASGAIGCALASRAAPDGATLLAASTNTHAVLPHLNRALPYDTLADFVPVVNLAYTTKLLLVNAQSSYGSVGALVADARRRPARLDYGSSGVGSSNHLDTEVFAREVGVTLTHIPYRGSAQAVAALLAGELHLLIASVTAALHAVRAGRLRALCTFSDHRAPLLPEVPTATEAGVPPIRIPNWIGFVAPVRTPATRIARLNEACNRILASDSTEAWLRSQGMEAAGGSTESFGSTIRADHARWGALIDELRV